MPTIASLYADDLRAALAVVGISVPVKYGLSRHAFHNYAPRIEVSHDYTQPDDPPHFPSGLSRDRNRALGHRVAAIDHGVVIRVWAESPEAGATQAEHEAAVLDIVDYIVVATHDILSDAQIPEGSGAGKCRWILARFVAPTETAISDGAEVTAGACYELRCKIPRAIVRRPKFSAVIAAVTTATEESSITDTPTPTP